MLSKDWDINIAEREAEFRDDLRAASGIGKRRRKVGHRRSYLRVLTKSGAPGTERARYWPRTLSTSPSYDWAGKPGVRR